MKNDYSFLINKNSPINGFGVFTERPIKRGEVFYTVPLDNVVDVSVQKFAYIGNSRYINDGAVLNWINHSCNPNTILDISTDQSYLKSINGIAPGEEITCDYNKTEKSGVKVKCNCKSSNCRGYFLRIE